MNSREDSPICDTGLTQDGAERLVSYGIVALERDALVIRVPFDILKAATEACPLLCPYDDDTSSFRSVLVTDVRDWARGVLDELCRESEDGTTVVHRMLDRAFLSAWDGGAEGIEDGARRKDDSDAC